MAEFASVYAREYKNGNLNRDWLEPTASSVSLAAGYKWSDSNYVLCLKIVLPSPAKSVTLSFCNASNGLSGTKTMRYNFTGEEDASLANATSDVAGDGTFQVESGDYVRSTVTIAKNLNAGTNYLYIWTNDSSKTGNVMWIRWENDGLYNFYGSYEALEGFSWIKDTAGVNPYHSYIKTADGPVLHAPYVFDGTNWNPLN